MEVEVVSIINWPEWKVNMVSHLRNQVHLSNKSSIIDNLLQLSRLYHSATCHSLFSWSHGSSVDGSRRTREFCVSAILKGDEAGIITLTLSQTENSCMYINNQFVNIISKYCLLMDFFRKFCRRCTSELTGLMACHIGE